MYEVKAVTTYKVVSTKDRWDDPIVDALTDQIEANRICAAVNAVEVKNMKKIAELKEEQENKLEQLKASIA